MKMVGAAHPPLAIELNGYRSKMLRSDVSVLMCCAPKHKCFDPTTYTSLRTLGSGLGYYFSNPVRQRWAKPLLCPRCHWPFRPTGKSSPTELCQWPREPKPRHPDADTPPAVKPTQGWAREGKTFKVCAAHPPLAIELNGYRSKMLRSDDLCSDMLCPKTQVF